MWVWPPAPESAVKATKRGNMKERSNLLSRVSSKIWIHRSRRVSLAFSLDHSIIRPFSGWDDTSSMCLLWDNLMMTQVHFHPSLSPQDKHYSHTVCLPNHVLLVLVGYQMALLFSDHIESPLRWGISHAGLMNFFKYNVLVPC